MYNFLKEAHNGLGMLILFFFLFVVISIIVMMIRKKSFGKFSKIVSLIGLIFVHIQILFGVILYFLSPLGMENFSGDSMKHDISRFYIFEHPIGMILAAALITIGYKRSKRTDFNSAKRHGNILIFYGMGFAIIAYLIPWFLWN